MPKLLIIDDEIDICEVVKGFFEPRGYEVVYALTGDGGLDAFDIEKPDIVILDLCLKDMWGIEVLKKIRAESTKCVVIIMTASASEGDRREAFKLGADYYVDKPFSIIKLKALLSKALQP